MTDASGRLLDLTRLVSRAGRTLTGIDRVELAYANHLAALDDAPLWGLVRTSLGYLLLDRTGVGDIASASRSGAWGSRDLWSLLSPKLGRKRQEGQSFARARAIARCRPKALPALLARHLPHGVRYLNIGHSNLTARTFAAVRALPGATITVMIHDTIPLDFPDFQRDGTVETFRARLAVAGGADRILTPSEASRSGIARHLGPRCPPVSVAPLGVTPADPLPSGETSPFFIAVGTIEPRKNLGLLFDIWAEHGATLPRLIVCGTWGWKSDDLRARIGAGIAGVEVREGLSDGAVAGLVREARALLFPSLAEGYGLPPVEALALGTPAICSDLPVLREILGPAGVYLTPGDRYQWLKMIEALAGTPKGAGANAVSFDAPSWSDHFKAVLRMT